MHMIPREWVSTMSMMNDHEWKMRCLKSPMWESEGAAWLEDENASSSGSREGNVCNDALHVTGLCGPGDKISLFLQDWEQAEVASSCHMALNMQCQELNGPWQLVCRCQGPSVTAIKAFLSPWTGCDKNGEGCGEMKEKERESRARCGSAGQFFRTI